MFSNDTIGAKVSTVYPYTKITAKDTTTVMTILANKGLVAVALNAAAPFFSYS
jgi:hypothetical protein